MAVSNDWQIISGIGYLRPTQTDGGSGYDTWFLNKTSAQKIANEIGWEQVELSDYVEQTGVVLTYNDISYSYVASDVHLIRPVADADEDEYNVGILPYAFVHPVNSSSSGSYLVGTLAFRLSDGAYLGRIDNLDMSSRCPSSFQLLRPFASGGFAFKASNSKYQFFDKFYNPKTEVTKWGTHRPVSGTSFIDLFTGLIITPNSNPSVKKETFSFGYFISLYKWTAISSAGIFKAKSLYRSVMGYGASEKTVEIDGVRYVNVGGGDFYIRLSD